MKQKYKVWDPDNCDEEDAEEVQSFEPQYAAEEYVEKNHSDLDYPDEIDVLVRAPDGKLTKWTVTVEQRPHFSATEVEIKEKGEANAT